MSDWTDQFKMLCFLSMPFERLVSPVLVFETPKNNSKFTKGWALYSNPKHNSPKISYKISYLHFANTQ